MTVVIVIADRPPSDQETDFAAPPLTTFPLSANYDNDRGSRGGRGSVDLTTVSWQMVDTAPLNAQSRACAEMLAEMSRDVSSFDTLTLPAARASCRFYRNI